MLPKKLYFNLRCISKYFLSVKLVFVLALISTAPEASELPEMGHSASRVLSPKEAHKLGEQVYSAIRQSSKWLDDVIIEDYVQRLANKLLSNEKNHDIDFRFFLLRDNSMNAFALPGGFVGVHTGLITATESESELAGVLAHEIAHVKLQHIARMYEHLGKMRLSTVVGIIASILLATQSAEAGSGAMAATLAGGQQSMINHTREHEKEADFEGMNILVRGGFDPNGMPSLFTRMAQDTRYYGSNIPEYLLTHPLTQSRLYSTKEQAKHYPYKQVPDSLLYHLVRTRIQAFSFHEPQDAVDFFEAQLRKGTYRNHLSAQYGYALSLQNAGAHEQASQEIQKCLMQKPHEPIFQLVFAESLIRRNLTDSAIQYLQSALSNHPNDKPLIYLYVSALKQKQDYTTARTALTQKHTLLYTDPKYYQALSHIYNKLKQPVQAHLAQAQHYKLIEDYGSALTQIRLARKLEPISSRDAQQIEAQMQEIQAIRSSKQ